MQFYKLSADIDAEPTILWVGDVSDPFVPFPKEGLMLNLVDDREKIDTFLDKLIAMYYTESRMKGKITTCAGAAASACKQMLNGVGGDVVLFSSKISDIGAGALKSRNFYASYNKDEEKALFDHTKEHDYYSKLGQKALADNVTFHIYLGVQTSNESVDLASLNQLVQLTGGDLHYFSKFSSEKHADKFYYEFFRYVSRNRGNEVSIKVRASTGFTVTEYFGGFGLREAVDFKLSSIDSDKTFCFQLRNDSKFESNRTVYVQIAMLYTTVIGERRIRIFNMAFSVTESLNTYFKQTHAENFC